MAGDIETEEEGSLSDVDTPLPDEWIHPQQQWDDHVEQQVNHPLSACSAVDDESPWVQSSDSSIHHRMKLNRRSWFPFNACVARSVGKAEMNGNE